MEKLYIALVNADGLFAGMIRKAIKIEYCHVVLSLDREFEEAYSFNRRNPAIPYFSGFVREDAQKLVKKSPEIYYKIMSIPCTKEQKEAIRHTLLALYEDRYSYHYCVLGLPFILMQVPFYQKNHYTCSSFTARLLKDYGIDLFDKHFSLVTPRDFYELQNTTPEYEGLLSDYIGAGGAWKEEEYAV